MNTTAHDPTQPTCLPLLSSQGWENILVEQFQNPSGECRTDYGDDHAICLSLAPRPVRFLQVKDGRTHSSLYGKGDIVITPAKMPFFARWEGEDHYMQIRVAAQFIQQVATEVLKINPDRLELLPEFRTRDAQIEAFTPSGNCEANGITPYQYLLQQRIERAKQLLKNSDPCGICKAARSIMDIAFLCEFNSHSHLSKQFRQFTGVTPKAYRAN
ncbi:helix-turn-helix transcriptional regulator [Phormidesmis sp. 146-12]